MVTGGDVLTFLRPNGGWVIIGNDYDSIHWDEGANKLTKAEFEAGFAQYEIWIANKEIEMENAKQSAIAKLSSLGLTTEDLKGLGL